jgi:hypothetical protein
MFFSITVRRGNDAPRRFLIRLTINSDLLEVAVLHRPGALPGPDRHGQQPFHTFLADPVAPADHRRGVDRQAMRK